MQNILALETTKYAIKIENFEGPLDLLCHLIDKNKMNINDIKISEIADQYLEYVNQMQEMNLDITSEFLVMASTLLYLKSKSLLPKQENEEQELTEEELIRRIIEYKKYKEITNKFKENFLLYSRRYFKQEEKINLPVQKIEEQYDNTLIPQIYEDLIKRNEEKINANAKNVEKLAITETYTVAEKVKEMFRELSRNRKFIFNKLFSIRKRNKQEVVTAFSGLLELSRRNKVVTEQEEVFGKILVEKSQRQINKV